MGRVDAQPSAGWEAERAVLGAMLIDESIVSQVLAEVDERDFTSTANRLIFQAAREVFREGGHADAITINAKLGYASGSPQQQQLIDLMEVTPTSASWREYAQLMREQAALGRIVTACHENNKFCIIYAGVIENAAASFKRGYDSVAYNVDTAILIEAYRDRVAQLRSMI